MMKAMLGKRVVNTRAVHQAGALNALLEARGAVPLAYPCIRIMPQEDTTALDNGLLDLIAGRYKWLVLTSANTVMVMAERLIALGLSLTGAAFHTAAVGPATAAAAQNYLGVQVLDLPDEYVAESLADHIGLEAGERIFLPESALAKAALAQALTARGARVDTVTAYQTVSGIGGVDLSSLLAHGQIDALTFSSSSAVTYFAERIQNEGGQLASAIMVPAACIGPKTSHTAYEHGFTTILTPSGANTLSGLVTTLEHYFEQVIKSKEHP